MHAFLPFVALLGLAVAQSDSATGTSTSAAPNPTASCLAKCAAGDVNCQAVCVNVPAPNESMIANTNQCSRDECTQGDSGPEDTKKYGECLASCASNYYYVSGGTPTGVATFNTASTASTANSNAASTTGSASTTGAAASASSAGSAASSRASSASGAAGSAASSASQSADAASSTGAAASLSLSSEMLTLSGGVVGLVVAALAM